MNFRKRTFSNIMRKIRKKIELKKFDGVNIKKFDEVSINTNLKCNLNCVMCHQGEIKCNKDMDYELFKKILTNLKKSKVTKVALIGGEIFLHKDIWKFIFLMEKMGFKYDLSSNLYNIRDPHRISTLRGLEFVNTSLDGLKDTHNKIRRNPLAFENAIKNLKLLLKLGVKVNSACVVQKANFQELEQLTSFLCKIGIKNISFLIENKILVAEKKNAINQLNDIGRGKADFFVTTIKNPLGELDEEDFSIIPKKILTIRKICKRYGVKLNLVEQLRNPRILKKEFPLREYTCSLFSGYDSYVYDDGNLSTCPFVKFSGEKFNLKRNKSLNILNSEEYVKIRKHFRKNGALGM